MKYSLDLNLLHTDQTKIQGVLDQLPDVSDAAVWGAGSSVSLIFKDDDTLPDARSEWQAVARIRFNDEADQQALLDVVSNLQGMLTDFAIGTWLKLYTTTHDENTPDECQMLSEYRVVA